MFSGLLRAGSLPTPGAPGQVCALQSEVWGADPVRVSPPFSMRRAGPMQEPTLGRTPVPLRGGPSTLQAPSGTLRPGGDHQPLSGPDSESGWPRMRVLHPWTVRYCRARGAGSCPLVIGGASPRSLLSPLLGVLGVLCAQPGDGKRWNFARRPRARPGAAPACGHIHGSGTRSPARVGDRKELESTQPEPPSSLSPVRAPVLLSYLQLTLKYSIY